MTSPLVAGKTKKSPCGSSDSQHLFEAVTKGKIHLTRFILAASNNHLVNAWDKDGRTALIACCDIKEEGTRDQIVQILLESGADVNMLDREGRSPLIHACEKRCNDIVRLLIHHHKIKPDMEDQYGNTALIYSAAVGNDVALELLTRNFRRLGLQVDHYNRQGNTALHVATKNGNLNCAKILAQKGRASVTLKDKEHGLTPMDWLVKKGFEKDEVDFLKPNTRFYRVAKLATSLSRSRASVGSGLGLEAKSKVSPTKSADSGGSKSIRAKITLSRSKSHAAGESINSQGKSGGVFRQSTVDGASATGSQQRQTSPRKSAGKSSGKSAPGVSPQIFSKKMKEDKKSKEDKVKSSKKMASNNAAISTHNVVEAGADDSVVPDVSPRENQAKVMAVKISRKYIAGTQGTLMQSTPECDTREDNFAASNGSGRLTGLGCDLSITSMQSSMTSLESYDARTDDFPPVFWSNDGTVLTNHSELQDNDGLVKPMYALGINTEEKAASVNNYFSNGKVTQKEGLDTTAKPRPTHDKENRKSGSPIRNFSQDGESLDESYQAAAQCKNASSYMADGRQTTRVSLKRNPSLRDIDCGEASSDAEGDDDDDDDDDEFAMYRESTVAQSLTRLSEEEGSLTSAGDQHAEAGHNLIGIGIPSPLPALGDCMLRSSSGRQDTTMISLRGAQQISQDA